MEFSNEIIDMIAKKIPGVPKQRKGSFHDTESLKHFKNKDIEHAFNILRQRFLNINEWQKYCSKNFSDFKLCDDSGKILERLPETGDYIRIDIPGLGGIEGDSYDWVQIVMLETAVSDMMMMQCKPCQKPFGSNGRVAHFYSKSGTSTFIISKGKNYLKAGIYGRNEKPNENGGFLDFIRNLLISIGGMLGFSKMQWKCLTYGWLDFE
ncbi:hypothetical protein [Chryseobacterium sp.]|uniref:hypothetical protein n=1 Tax=Chryseobacterium sp. TaxID=1871047 RepID=UPI00289EE13A|nr:hypothetical protein [Chryseobacterium sp.]